MLLQSQAKVISISAVGPLAYARCTAIPALHHLSNIWNAELADEGIRFLSLDPGDMDTPLHAVAVPDASVRKRPRASLQTQPAA